MGVARAFSLYAIYTLTFHALAQFRNGRSALSSSEILSEPLSNLRKLYENYVESILTLIELSAISIRIKGKPGKLIWQYNYHYDYHCVNAREKG